MSESAAGQTAASIAYERTPPDSVGELAAAAGFVFFDCDGVLLDSNRIKINAVAHALADVPDVGRRACLDAFAVAFGRGRAEHFAAFHRILGESPESRDAFIERRSAAYASYLADAYPKSPPAPGALDLLRMLSALDRPCAVVTGGVGAEATRALDAAGFAGAFISIVGTPTPKALAMRTMLDERGVLPSEAVIFGDATADRDAANEVGVPFVFVSGLALVDENEIVRGLLADRPRAFAAKNLAPDTKLAPLVGTSTLRAE